MKIQFSNYALHIPSGKILLSILFIFFLFSPLPVYSLQPATNSQHYVIVVDNSGSMKKADASKQALDLIFEFQKRLKPKDKLTLISVGSTPRILFQKEIPANGNGKETFDYKSLSFDEMFTDLQGGFSFLLEYLEKRQNVIEPTFVLFLTDGMLDLVSQKNALFPKSLLHNKDYQKLLSRYARYIRGNRIQKNKITVFNKDINKVGAAIFSREIIPKLKNRITPLFILTFADKSPLLREISGQIALKEGMENYFLIREAKDRNFFLDTFFSYVVRLEKMAESGKFEVKSNNQAPPPAILPKHQTGSRKRADYFYAFLWSCVFLTISAFVVINIRRFLKSNRDITESELIHGEAILEESSKMPDAVDELLQTEVETSPVAPSPEPNEHDPAEESLPDESGELKKELLLLNENELLQRLKQLDEFQRNALTESDEYLNSLLKKLYDESSPDIVTNLKITENRHTVRHIIPAEYALDFRFVSDMHQWEGKVFDISLEGIGLSTVPDVEMDSDPFATGTTGILTLLKDGTTVVALPASIVFGISETGRLGISPIGLKEDPDIKLVWLETYTNSLAELKRQKNGKT